ncbi:MAG TPA: CpaD family pilus assembly protein [Sphingomonas sp.]|nr:CpaD family pilus assembly protein [Sphingomonas sp.]
MINRPILLASLAPALLLGACMGTQNRGLESVHQPVVSRSDYAIDLAVAGGRLAAGERQRLGGWMDSMQVSFGDRVAIDDPASDGVAARRDVAAVVAGYGLLLSTDAPITAAAVTPGTIRVVISRMRASVPGCPDWSRNASTEFNSNTSSNQGCAINSNLAAMVARPEDLVHGQSVQPGSDPTISTKAIGAYRKAIPTGNGNTVGAVSAKGN